MANERLRTTMLERGETPQSIATAVRVDPKTVERWLGGRTPYTRTRYELARFLEADEVYLWPGSKSASQLAGISESEILTVYPHRWAVPRDAWTHLFDGAEDEIGILVFSGFFLSDDPGIRHILQAKAEDGVRVRILMGDPDSPELQARGEEEGIGVSLAAKVRNAIINLRPLDAVEGIEIRLHATTLYNSIYRGDDELLVNSHIYGMGAAEAPMMHLKQVASGALVTTYLTSFERVWGRRDAAEREGLNMGRIDYYDDPDAPAANSVVPSANVIVLNEAGQVLVIHRDDNDNWAVPGGGLDLGESLVECAVRETKEETGIDCEVTGLVGIYTDPKHIVYYDSDGEARQEFSVLFTARAVGGEPTPSSESRDVVWVDRDKLAELTMDRSMWFRVGHWLEGRTTPYLG